MNRALIVKCIRESRWLLAGCAAAIFAFCWLRVWMVSRLDTSRFQAILDLLPEDWKRFSPVDVQWLVTYAGRISLAYDEPIVVFCVSIWAIARGSDCVSGELNRGTMEMLLAQPLSRRQTLWTPATVNVVGVATLAAAAWWGTWGGIQATTVPEQVRPSIQLPFSVPYFGRRLSSPLSKVQTVQTPMRDKVDPAVFLPAAVNLFSLGFFWAGFATFVSACDRYRWRTIGVVVAVYVVQMALKIVGMSADRFDWLRYFSIFTAYEPESLVYVAMRRPAAAWQLTLDEPIGPLVVCGPLGYHLILLTLGYLAFAAASVIFQRRDL